MNYTIMVPWNREDWSIISPKGLIKLVIIVLTLAKVVDDISKMKEEGWEFPA